MNAKHTPGPWIYQGQENICTGKTEWIVKTPEINAVSRVIATTPFSKHYNDHEANARLISVAPELLEALKEAVANFEAMDISKEEGDDEISTIRKWKEAIFKATGEKNG